MQWGLSASPKILASEEKATTITMLVHVFEYMY